MWIRSSCFPFFDEALKALGGGRQKGWTCRQVPVGVDGIAMPQIDGQVWQECSYIEPLLLPYKQALNRKRVA